VAVILVLLLSQIALEPGVKGIPLPRGLKLTTNIVRNEEDFLRVQMPPRERILIDYIEANTELRERVVTDGGHRVVFWAGRASTPSLCDITRERLDSGWLAGPQVIESTKGVTTVVLHTGLFKRFPDFLGWLQTNYDEVPVPADKAAVFRRKSSDET
jgi:hypothetical protein